MKRGSGGVGGVAVNFMDMKRSGNPGLQVFQNASTPLPGHTFQGIPEVGERLAGREGGGW